MIILILHNIFPSSIFIDSIHILNLCFSPIKTVLIARENSPSPFEDLLNLEYCLAYSEHKKIHWIKTCNIVRS